MGVRVSEIIPEIKTATTMVIANSFKILPMIPPMKTRGMNTEARQMVMERMVKLICFEPLLAGSLLAACFWDQDEAHTNPFCVRFDLLTVYFVFVLK